MDMEQVNAVIRNWLDDTSIKLDDLSSETIEPATGIELGRFIAKAAQVLNSTPDIQEYTMDIKFPPIFMAQVLMENLAHVMDAERLNIEQKVYWLQVAEHMGPDWIGMFRKVGAFMAKSEEF